MKRNESDNAINTLSEAAEILKKVENPRQLWQAHASLGSVFGKLNRFNEAHEQWFAAAKIIQDTAKSLSDRDLREGFLKAEPVRHILSKAER